MVVGGVFYIGADPVGKAQSTFFSGSEDVLTLVKLNPLAVTEYLHQLSTVIRWVVNFDIVTIHVQWKHPQRAVSSED